MRAFFTLWRRELATYFRGPLAYVVTVFFLVVTGFNFWFLVNLMASIQGVGAQVLTQLFGSLFFWIPFLVVVPVLTMRLLAEERRFGTYETLMTAPITETQVVLAKYAGALTLFVLMWAPTISYGYLLERFSAESTPMDPGALAGGYLGTFLVGGFFIAVGLFCSAVTRNHVISALACFAAMSVVFISGFLHYITTNPVMREISSYTSSVAHMLEFSRGLVDSRPIVLYVTATALVLFGAVRALEWRRW
jgi:ABC-2 type transport system permease protein